MASHEPLTQVWARDGSAVVVISCLEDAGFHPLIECDPRGWMHFYGWPFGSCRSVTVWVPAIEIVDARAFLAAPCQPSWERRTQDASFAGKISRRRKMFYAGWLAWYALGYGVGVVVTVIQVGFDVVRART